MLFWLQYLISTPQRETMREHLFAIRELDDSYAATQQFLEHQKAVAIFSSSIQCRRIHEGEECRLQIMPSINYAGVPLKGKFVERYNVKVGQRQSSIFPNLYLRRVENQSQLPLPRLHRWQLPKRLKRVRLRCLIMRTSFSDGKSQVHENSRIASVLGERQVNANEVNTASQRWQKSMNIIIKCDYNT